MYEQMINVAFDTTLNPVTPQGVGFEFTRANDGKHIKTMPSDI